MVLRRKELASDDMNEYIEIASNAPIGYLGLVDHSGYPRIVPLNFALIGRTIYFHGASEGEKYNLLGSSPKASFSIDVPYSYIPSYWTSPKNASPASHFFKSVHVRGVGKVVKDLEEKAKGLQALMEKYQPEGGYVPISMNEPIYKGILAKVAVFKVIPDQITIKLKFGQNESSIKINQIIKGLKERGTPIDLATISMIRKYHPKTDELL